MRMPMPGARRAQQPSPTITRHPRVVLLLLLLLLLLELLKLIPIQTQTHRRPAHPQPRNLVLLIHLPRTVAATATAAASERPGGYDARRAAVSHHALGKRQRLEANGNAGAESRAGTVVDRAAARAEVGRVGGRRARRPARGGEGHAHGALLGLKRLLEGLLQLLG